MKGLVGVWDETEDGFRLWDLSSARLLRTISDPKTATFLGNPITVSLTPVEIAFADVDTAEITIWDLSSPVMGREAKRRDWEDVLFSHCGKFLASSTKDEVHEAIVDIWDAERGETSFRLNSGDIGSVICMTFSSDNSLLAFLWEDRGSPELHTVISIWETATWTIRHKFILPIFRGKKPRQVNQILISPDNRRFAYTSFM